MSISSGTPWSLPMEYLETDMRRCLFMLQQIVAEDICS
jgi:hypothetical protein